VSAELVKWKLQRFYEDKRLFFNPVMLCAGYIHLRGQMAYHFAERHALSSALFGRRSRDPGDLPVDSPESAHMADVIRSVHLDLKSVRIKELERFFRLSVRKLEVHFR